MNYNLGNAYKASGDNDNAITAYKKAIQIDPNLTDAYVNLGIVLQSKGFFDLSIKFYEEALLKNDNQAEIYNNLGISWHSKNDPKRAINATKRHLI